MTTALKKIETKAIQLGLKFSTDKCAAILYRSNDPDCNFKIAEEKIPWRASVKYLWVIIYKIPNFRKQVDYQKYIHSNYTINGTVTFEMMVPSNIDRLQVSQKQGMRLILGVPRDTSAKMMRHGLQMLPREHGAKLTKAKLYRKIRGNTDHPLHTPFNRRQRNEWTTEIQQCHRLPLGEPTQLQRDDTAPWEHLPYKCRIEWTREGTELLKQTPSRIYPFSSRRHHVLYRRLK